MLRRLYDWTLSLASHRHAAIALAVIAFVESSFFPIPPDILLIPMILAARNKAWRYATICMVASVLGGLAGYAIGHFLFESVGQPVLGFYGYASKFEQFRDYYNEWGAWAVFIAGVTPFPYKVITILSGVTGLDPVIFSVASVLARGIRFFLIAGLIWQFGPPIRDFIEKRLGLVFTIFIVGLVGGFVAIKYLL
ncbi:YqaA family protein [Thalassospira marina]|uniref:Cytochrome B n=1 Tax=Thalassospira marina TaxID=2048283 RepID=A0A2N3KDD0_9PROT|nr:YqaA family protein [Thalassospira marina]AUG51717.1 cytochrome B [Thalassospira marina]PKR48540.1 cytochrome B [Thalassospira marina]